MASEAQKQRKYKQHGEKIQPQKQDRQPGIQQKMQPKPIVDDPDYRASGKLKDRVALITGGDSGIGQAVAIIFAKEGADVAIVYMDVEEVDAQETKKAVEKYGRRCLLLPADLRKPKDCARVVEKTLKYYSKLDILVNNAAFQQEAESLEEVSDEQLERTFETNVYSAFRITRAALPHLKEGSCVINTSSVTAYRGSPHLIDYSATKGALITFTRSLSGALAEKKIRVNAVAPGPIWTPLIPATFEPEKVEKFGEKEPLGRPGQPAEVAPSYVFLASTDSTYITGQVLHPNGGAVVNG